jgi:hypothetical protein
MPVLACGVVLDRSGKLELSSSSHARGSRVRRQSPLPPTVRDTPAAVATRSTEIPRTSCPCQRRSGCALMRPSTRRAWRRPSPAGRLPDPRLGTAVGYRRRTASRMPHVGPMAPSPLDARKIRDHRCRRSATVPVMAEFVHITAARAARRIERSGIAARSHGWAGGRGVYCTPVLSSFTLTYQWVRELRRWHPGCAGRGASAAGRRRAGDRRALRRPAARGQRRAGGRSDA